MITNEKLHIIDSIVKQVNHQAYFIQVNRIKSGSSTKLGKLLSIFEQANFVGDGTKLKIYSLGANDSEIEKDEEIKELKKILESQ